MKAEVLLLAAHGPAAWGEVAEHLDSRRPLAHADLTADSNVEDMATRALVGRAPRFALVGQCLGGVVALEILRRVPERIVGLALIATTVRADTVHELDRRRSRLAALRELVAVSSEPDDDYLDRAERWLAAPASLADPAKRAAIRNAIRGLPLDMACRQQEALLARADLTDALKSAPARILIVSGDIDRLSPPTRSREARSAAPWANYLEMQSCGHLVALEAPASLTEALECMLA